MFSLEHEAVDKKKAAVLMPTLQELEMAKNDWKDDYALNSMLRKELRVNFIIYIFHRKKHMELF